MFCKVCYYTQASQRLLPEFVDAAGEITLKHKVYPLSASLVLAISASASAPFYSELQQLV